MTKNSGHRYDKMDQENSKKISNKNLFREEKYCGPDIDDYFEQLFPGMETTVYHEIASCPTHIDVFIKEPNEKIPHYVLFTTGMSTLAMKLPDSLQEKKAELERAELCMLLPKSFNMGSLLGTALQTLPLKKTWPVYALKSLARFPYENRTWFGSGHTIGPYSEPIAPGTQQCGVILLPMFDNNHGRVMTPDGTVVNLYCVVPLYREEIEYCRAHGEEEWEKISKDLPVMVDLQRHPLC